MKIILLGNAGAGKSTMAKKLMGNQNIPRLSLDEVAWAEPAVRKPVAESIEQVKAFIGQHDHWILEGCYSDIMEPILPDCEELRFLNPGIETCIQHCHARPWEPEKFESAEQQDANLQNLINWVNKYETRNDEYGLKQHRKLFDAFTGKKREYTCVSDYESCDLKQDDPMSSEWDEIADGWDSNEEVILYAKLAFESLRTLASLEGKTILDFGCGTGCLTEKLAALAQSIVGLDSSPAMLRILQQKQLPNVETIEGELSPSLITDNTLLHKQFDLITASSVCGFLPDYKGTLKMLKSRLVPGGLFVQWDWQAADTDAEFGLTAATIQTVLEETGFEEISVSIPFSMKSPNGEMNVLMGVGKTKE